MFLFLKDEVNDVSLIMESDFGAFKPRGIGFNGKLYCFPIAAQMILYCLDGTRITP